MLDSGHRELLRASKPIAVRPQVFDLMEYLIRNRACAVSKDDLIATIWKGTDRIGIGFGSANQRGPYGNRRFR